MPRNRIEGQGDPVPRVRIVSGSSGYLNSGVRVPFLASGNNGCMAGVTTELARVLIVDDKADIRNLLATRLRLEPAFDVVGEAANGAEAIARVGELKPHLMVLDLQMPVMSGEEVIPIVRSLAPRLQVVVFSAYAGTGGRLGGTERPDAEVRKGMRAAHAWTRCNPQVRQVAADQGWTGEFLALVGVFLTLGQALRDAATTGRSPCHLRFGTRLNVGRAARRALTALGGEMGQSLEPLRSLLLRALP